MAAWLLWPGCRVDTRRPGARHSCRGHPRVTGRQGTREDTWHVPEAPRARASHSPSSYPAPPLATCQGSGQGCRYWSTGQWEESIVSIDQWEAITTWATTGHEDTCEGTWVLSSLATARWPQRHIEPSLWLPGTEQWKQSIQRIDKWGQGMRNVDQCKVLNSEKNIINITWGHEGHVDPGHVGSLHGGDELVDSGNLVIPEIPQQRGLEQCPEKKKRNLHFTKKPLRFKRMNRIRNVWMQSIKLKTLNTCIVSSFLITVTS